MSNSQKSISRNRAPRVHIEYDVHTKKGNKKVELPFVIGVLADLSGKPEEPLPSLDKREFVKISADTFDDVMKSMKPRVAFQVPNTLTKEGQMSVDLTFEKMEDFSPANIAKKVEPLRKLLEARTELANLLKQMDGRSDAEELLEKMFKSPELMKALAESPKPKPASETENS